MKLHEIIQEYECAGIKNHDLRLMEDLSRAGLEPDSVANLIEKGLDPCRALRYREVGVVTVEEMLAFKEMNITPQKVAEYSSCGFSTLEQIRTIKEKKLDVDGDYISLYSKSGFYGDLDAIIELSENGVSSGYARTLGCYGLKGDKKDMLEVSSKVTDTHFMVIAKIIAEKLSANKSDSTQNKEGDEKRISADERFERIVFPLAGEINAYDIAALATSSIGKTYLSQNQSLPIVYLAIFDEDQELITQYNEQTAVDYKNYNHRASTNQLYHQIQNKRKEKLFEEYQRVKSSREMRQHEGE